MLEEELDSIFEEYNTRIELSEDVLETLGLSQNEGKCDVPDEVSDEIENNLIYDPDLDAWVEPTKNDEKVSYTREVGDFSKEDSFDVTDFSEDSWYKTQEEIESIRMAPRIGRFYEGPVSKPSKSRVRKWKTKFLGNGFHANEIPKDPVDDLFRIMQKKSWGHKLFDIDKAKNLKRDLPDQCLHCKCHAACFSWTDEKRFEDTEGIHWPSQCLISEMEEFHVKEVQTEEKHVYQGDRTIDAGGIRKPFPGESEESLGDADSTSERIEGAEEEEEIAQEKEEETDVHGLGLHAQARGEELSDDFYAFANEDVDDWS